MNRRLFGVVGVLTIAALPLGSCKSDPLSDLDGTPAALVTDFDLVRVAVGDTVSVTATVYDARSTPLEVPVTFTPCSGVATTVIDPEYHPVPATSARALIIGSTLGETCVVASAAGLQDTVDVMTFPDRLVITGGPANDTLESATVTPFTFQFFDHQGNPLSGLPTPTFTSSDTTRGKVTGTASGADLQTKSPGPVTLTALGVGVDPAGITGTRSITVIPGVFTGTVTPSTMGPADTVTLTAAGGGQPGFDADTRVEVNGVRAFTFSVTAGTMKFVVPGIGVTGSVPLLVSNMGADQAAQKTTVTSNTASFDDPYDPANDDPSTAPLITANGDYFIVLSGTCSNGVGGADCDDFFKIKNNAATSKQVTVTVAWFTAADVDAYGLDPSFTFCDIDGNCAGATAANPESFKMTIPAGATWFAYLNLFATGGSSSTLVRVRVAGLP